MPPTLQQLAAVQAGNPANPWLTSAGVPQAVADYANGQSGATIAGAAPAVPAPNNAHTVSNEGYKLDPAMSDDVIPAGMVIGPNGQLKPMSNVNDNSVGGTALPKTAKEAVEWNNLNTPNAAPASAPPAKAVTPATLGAVPLKLGGGGGGPDPMKPWLQGTGENIERQKDILNQQGDIINKQQETASQGQADAAKLAQIAELNDQANAVSINLLTKKAQADATFRAGQLERSAAAVREAEANPPNWFKEKGTAGSILAAISVAAGAFAAAMPHTNNNQNQALGIINSAIDRDTAAHDKQIQGMWKNVEFQVNEDQRQFAKDQFIINQRNEVRRMDYTHAIALVDRQLANTNNAVAVQGMQSARLGLVNETVKLDQQMTDHRLQVAQVAQKQAAAAAAANPYSAANANKAYMEYVKDATKANLEHPDKPVPVMSRDQWLPGYMGQGREAPDAVGGKAQKDKEAAAAFASGVSEVGKTGEAATKANLGTWLLAKLPAFLTPESHMTENDLTKYNEAMLPTAIRLLGEREPPESIAKKVESFKLERNEPEALQKQKIASYQQFLRTASQVQQGKKGPPGGEDDE